MGFGRNNLQYFRKFYAAFPNCTTLSCKLSWSHYFEILKSDDPLEISFYTKQCEIERWSVRELQRQMKSMLFHRLALSKDKEGVLALAHKGVEVQKPADIIRDPMVLGMYRKRYRTYRNSSWCLQRRNNSRICPSGDYESIVCHKVSTVFTRSTIIEG